MASAATSEVKKDLGLLKQTFKDFSDDECPRMAAALSYYTVFSLPPLLILILTILSAVFDQRTVEEALQGQMGSLMGETGKQQVTTIFAQAEQPQTSKGIASVLGIIALIFGATGVFGELQKALNRAWEVEPDPDKGGLLTFLFKRVFSFGMILAVAFLLLVSLALTAALSAFGDALGGGLPEPVLHIFNLVVSFVVIALLFAAMFKVLPDAEIAWRDVLIGGAVTGLLFTIGKFLIGLYLGRSNPGEAYGAAGSLALVLVWIYYSSMILLFGAEFTQTWANTRGGGIKPEKGAVRVVENKEYVRDDSSK